VRMNPGCPGALAGTIQPAGEPMSGQPDKRMSVLEQGGWRCNIERPVLIWVSVAVVTPANATSHTVPDVLRALEWWGVSKSVTKAVAGAECA